MKSKLVLVSALLLLLTLSLAAGVSANGGSFERTYTLDADFDEGGLVNVNHDAPDNDQLQLDSVQTPFDFIWVAVSTKGTVVKIDTKTGDVLGEYATAPAGMSLNPSRTTVDGKGNVWVTNRNESSVVAMDAIAPGVPPVARPMGSAVYIGLQEMGECVDRNGNGTIETSAGLGDVRLWPNTGSADSLGGASTAQDECIINYVRVNSTGARHVSVDAYNDVWISGTGGQYFDLVDSTTGAIIDQQPSVGFGGYGGLIDANGVIWSARNLLRWDTALPLVSPNYITYSHDSYGLCIDSSGNVWNTALNGNAIRKFNPSGALLGVYTHGDYNAQGCVVDDNDHVWVAHTLYSGKNTVGHLLNDGTFIGNVMLDSSMAAGPTGVAVDGDNKVWATGYSSGKAYRIDPAAGAIGADGVTPIGAVDFTSVYLGGNLYNYSDMTGSTLIAPPNEGTWSVVADSAIAGAEWQVVSWTADEPGESSLAVTVASSADGVTFGPEEPVANEGNPTVYGQYLKISVSFTRGTGGESPILYDLTVNTNRPPVCDEAVPSRDILWQPNHKFYAIDVLNVTDPDGHDVTITIDAIVQDEEVDTYGDGRFTPDGDGVGTSTAHVRAERAGSRKVPGDGRIYIISFTADDGHGLTCSSTVRVGVPHDRRRNSVPQDSGPPYYDSTALAP